MVEYPDLQGKNILEIEPKYYNNLNIDGFSKMMKSPSYCYKFYWLEAIIQLISEGKTESTFDEIIDDHKCMVFCKRVPYSLKWNATGRADQGWIGESSSFANRA